LPAPPPSGLGPAAAGGPAAASGSGTVTVAVAQASDISIDGHAYGSAPTGDVALPAGPHIVVIRNASMHWVHTVHFDLAPGERRAINVDLNQI
jgi:hypothetical protein